MIVVDASALLAPHLREPGDEAVRAVFDRPGPMRIAPANWLEARIVSERNGIGETLASFVAARRIEIVPTDAAQTQIAWDAFRRFGKGRHPAALNLADCFAYALARTLDAPLLYVGEDFARTDIRTAIV